MPSKIDAEKIKAMKILRANGMTYKDIGLLVGVAESTANNYTKDVAVLPRAKQRNPFTPISIEAAKKVADARVPTSENRRIAEEIGDVDYWIEDHVQGERFAEGIDDRIRRQMIEKVPLEKMQEMMDIPTGYKSGLSTRAWFKKYLEGLQGRYLKYPPHKWTEKQLQVVDLFDEHKKLMIKIHRDFGKTMAGGGIVTQDICEHPNNNYGIGSETKAKAAKRVKQVGDILLTNKYIMADYGFLPHAKKFEGTRQRWTKDELTVKRDIYQTDPTLICFSAETADVTGMHFNGIYVDDVWSRRLDRNPKNKEKFVEWWDGELEGCLEDAWELWIYTRKSPTDVYQDFEDKQYYVVYKLPAILKYPTSYKYIYKTVHGKKVFSHVEVYTSDWEISDTERFTVEFFLEKALKMNPVEFESEYQLNPMARTGSYWNWDNIQLMNSNDKFYHLVEPKRREQKLKIVGGFDLAYGKSARADFAALAVVGIYDHKYYILEVYLKRGASESDLAGMIRKAKADFPFLSTVYVEEDFWQAEKVQNLKKRLPHMSLLPVRARQEQSKIAREDSAKKVDLKGKQLRIWDSMEALIEDRKVWVNKNMAGFKEFRKEFVTFPRCVHFDALDAVSMCFLKMRRRAALIYAISG
jgi:phage terminase large subunit-like protein